MHHGNHFYGHAHLLARYCGLTPEDRPRIKGYLQHGWSEGEGYGSRIERAPGAAAFVWSERTRRRSLSVGGVTWS